MSDLVLETPRGVRGFMFPRSAGGRSSLVPPPPSHHCGQLLPVGYRTDPAAVGELLPLREPAAEDPGAELATTRGDDVEVGLCACGDATVEGDWQDVGTALVRHDL